MSWRLQRAAAGTLVGLVLLGVAPSAGSGQVSDAVPTGARRPSAARTAALIDTVVLRRHNVFTPDEARRHFIFRAMNAVHVITSPTVIRRELLLDAGEPFDSIRADESERNLRSRRLFSDVRIDSVRLDGRLAMQVRTQDAWSTRPKLEFAAAADGTITGTIGITELNLLGTGIPLQLWYRKLVDRDGLETATALNRFAGTKLFVAGGYRSLSDQKAGRWRLGVPFYSASDQRSFDVVGETFSGRILQFRTEASGERDTTVWRRRALENRLAVAFAPAARSAEYLRVGITAEVRREEYLLRRDTAGVVPDSVYGLVGAFVEYRQADFEVVRYLNGFTREDQDLSEYAFVSAKLAPGGWGYGTTGIAPRLLVGAGGRLGSAAILKAIVDAQGLFNSAGLDSGRVVGRATLGVKPHERHSLFLDAIAGVQHDPAPGTEFDLGFQTPPRLWSPHAFTGTRTVRTTLEHRWYVWDDIFQLASLGFVGFVDYGGAWYDDQEARFGGNVAVGVLLGSTLSAFPQAGQLSVGYRFGGRVPGNRWAVSFGAALIY